MNLPELGVKRPITTLAVFTIILIIGIISLSQLGIDLLPDITLPAISITTTYPGAGAEDVEQQVTKVIEDAVNTVPNIDHVSSTSQENISSVIAFFKWGTDIDQASMDVRDVLGFTGPFMPDGANNPMVFKFDASAMPVLFIGLSAEESYPDLYELADKKLVDPLTRIEGVGSVNVYGGIKRQINVYVDGAALTSRGMSINQIVQILRASNISMPGGEMEIGTKEFVIRFPAEFRTVEEIRNVQVGNIKGSPVYLKDIARVEDGFAEQKRISRMDGKPSVMLIIQKQSGANTVKVVDAVWRRIQRLKKSFPEDVDIKKVFDGSVFIKQSINNLARTILWAGVLVILVVIVFLRNLRSSLIIAFILPFSLIVAFIFLRGANYTINIMSLSSLAIAIGMVVDNGIVVFENIFRHRTEFGEGRAESAIFGSREVASAITASTLTTVVIFVPLLFVQGISGILFRQLGFVIMFVLSASLFTALYLTPMLSSRFLKIKIEDKSIQKKAGIWSRIYQWSERGFKKTEQFYKRMLTWSLKHKILTIASGVMIFIITMFFFRFVNTEFFPQADQSQLNGTVELPVGTSLDKTNRVMKQIENIIERYIPEKDVITTRCGTSEYGFGVAMGREEGNNVISIQGTLIPKAQRDASDVEVGYRLSSKIREIPGIKSVDFTTEDPFVAMFGGGKPIEIEIYGYDIALTDSFARKVAGILQSVKGTTDITISRKEGKPEYWVRLDRDKAARVGLTPAQIAMSLRNSFYGNDEVKFREKGEEYPVFIQLGEMDRKTISDIGDVMITSPAGMLIPLKSLATIEQHTAPVKIQRKDQQRIVTVGCGIMGRAMGAVAKDVQRKLSKLKLPEGIEYKVAGAIEQQAESFKDLGTAMIIGIILVYLVMAAQFESLIDPFIIMFSVPFAIVGVVWALIITGTTLSINAFIGMIMLVGIVVNNAIVLIDYTNILRQRGFSVREAILTAGQRRMRPVLMTALTTIFGLMPLALNKAEGAETWVPLGVTVIGGLFVSTLITLVFVPTLYSIFEERLKGRRLFGKLKG